MLLQIAWIFHREESKVQLSMLICRQFVSNRNRSSKLRINKNDYHKSRLKSFSAHCIYCGTGPLNEK